MKTSYFLLFLFLSSNLFPQIYDSFSDGDFTLNPVWSGDIGDWEIAQNNSSGTNGTGTTNTLRLAASVSEAGTKYLSSQMTGSWGSEQSWSFWIGRRSGSAASADNQSIVWLWANESNLNSSTVDGYRIIFGKSLNDNIILEFVADGSGTSLIISDSAVVSEDDISFMVRVTRSNSSLWSLYSSALPNTSGEGPSANEIPTAEITNLFQGSYSDSTYTLFDDGYIGIMANHTSGSSALTGAEFDQIYFDTDASSALPVELINFKGIIKNDNVVLNWETATEVDNFGFDVERTISILNINLSEMEMNTINWKSLGFMKGRGNSNSTNYYSFIDKFPQTGVNIYRLKQIDFNGSYDYSNYVLIEYDKVNFIKLEQNFPNPFNPYTNISFFIPHGINPLNSNNKTTLKVYNLLGQLVGTLINGLLPPGRYEIVFNGSELSSGFYYYMLEYGNYKETKKMLLAK